MLRWNVVVLVAILPLVSCQNTVSGTMNAVSEGLSNFSMEILAKTSAALGDDHNLILSSFSIWTLLSIINAGAAGVTSEQIVNALRLPRDQNVVRAGLKQIEEELMYNTNGVELDTANAIFIDEGKRLYPNFQNHAASQYKVTFSKLNFQDPKNAVPIIDKYVDNITKGKIKHFINYDDLKNAHMLLTTAIYFKGNWNLPFNKTATSVTDFYDETLTQVRGKVDMMYQIGPFPYSKLSGLRGHVIELPYGQDEKYAMLVILPMKNVGLNEFLNQLSTRSLKTIFDDLERAKSEFYGEDVQVYLPKFSISSDYVINAILEQMGITHLFGAEKADLQNISPDKLFLSKVIHKATIDVDEEGTVASAVSGGQISYKSPPATFNASHPFLYIILEQATKTILFVGKYSNPNA